MPWKITVEQVTQNVMEIEIGWKKLADELVKINTLKGQEMPDMIGIVSGRIVEALSRVAVFRAEIGVRKDGEMAAKFDDITTDTNTNLDRLYLYGEIDDGSLASAHALRRFGNDARHPFNQPIDEKAESTIVGLLQLFLEWYACKFPHGLKNPPNVIGSQNWSGNNLLRRLASGSPSELIFTNGEQECLLNNSVLAGFAGERLINCKSELADKFTMEAFNRHWEAFNRYSPKKSHRVVEMRALYLSRNENPNRALAFAKTYMVKFMKKDARYSEADSFGILGGTYKNHWLHHPLEVASLENAYNCYSEGSKMFRENYYLRVNVAATALWLEKKDEAKDHANIVLGQFEKHPPHITLNYWLAATLAEANFIAGNHGKAHELYKQARQLDKTGGRWKRTRQQLGIHLNMMGQPELENTYQDLS